MLLIAVKVVTHFGISIRIRINEYQQNMNMYPYMVWNKIYQ